MTQEAIKTRKQVKQNCDDMNETEDLNKYKNQICKMMKQHPNMFYMLTICCKK